MLDAAAAAKITTARARISLHLQDHTHDCYTDIIISPLLIQAIYPAGRALVLVDSHQADKIKPGSVSRWIVGSGQV